MLKRLRHPISPKIPVKHKPSNPKIPKSAAKQRWLHGRVSKPECKKVPKNNKLMVIEIETIFEISIKNK